MNWVKKGILFNKEWAQLPVVDTHSDVYKVYYSTRDEKGRSIPKCSIITKNLELTEEIFANQSILPLGKPDSFDGDGIMPSSIVTLKDGTKYMYYVGWSKRVDVPYWNSTGLAISENGGITWKKYSEKPIFQGDGENWVGTVEVIPPESSHKKWTMYYSSAHWEEIEGKLEPVYDIKEAYSYDGIQWETAGIVVAFLNENEGGIAAFRSIKGGYLFSVRNKFDYRENPKNSYRIKSVDSYIDYEILELEPSGDEIMCAYPFVIEETDRYIMFYNSDFGKSGISYAIKMK